MSLGALLFGLVDRWLPDHVQDRYGYGSDYRGDNDYMRWCIAAMLVAVPIYYGLTRKHFADYAANPERRSSPVRKWLTYLTLTVLALVLIGDVIDLIGNVLGGEYALRFLVKVAIVLIIAGGVFMFYIWELRWKETESGT